MSLAALQWTHDSAFRFFPLVEHPELGLTLHPFDLATNKVLALVGRVEARDWIDILQCDSAVQPLGYLAWAATGKDPGLAPDAILQEAGRSARYSAVEIAALAFDGPAPDAIGPVPSLARSPRECHANRGAVAVPACRPMCPSRRRIVSRQRPRSSRGARTR